MRRDLKESIDLLPSIQPQAHTATVSGSGVDLNADGPYNAAIGYVQVGSYTDGTAKYKLQHQDDGGTWSNVSSGNLDGSATISITSTAQSDSVFEVAYRGSKDQLRWKITSVANMTTGHEGAAYIAGGAKRSK